MHSKNNGNESADTNHIVMCFVDRREAASCSGSGNNDVEESSSSSSSENSYAETGDSHHCESMLTHCGSGDCHGCCHGDCGCCGYFACHDGLGRGGVLRGCCNATSFESDVAQALPGSSEWLIGESSFLGARLRFQSSLLKEAVDQECNSRKVPFFSEFRDKVFSFLALVAEAVGMLERSETIEEKLLVTRQLLRSEKEKNTKLREDYVLLEYQLREVNKDYGQLLVKVDTKDETLGSKPLPQRGILLDKSTETEQRCVVNFGTQTEVCGEEEMAGQVSVSTTLVDDVSVATEQGRFDAPLDSNEENCCEAEGSVSCDQVDYCNEDEPLQTKDFEATARDDLQQASCLPNKSQSTDGESQSSSENDAAPLLREQTGEHAGEENAAGSSVPSMTWPCDHYKRLCLVKFDCCEKFYPCHKCHNKTGECSIQKLRSIDAKLLKCLACNEVQNFTETSQNCVKCGIEFAKYFCGFCHHLTGTDQKPFHCFKCGICRVNSDRSFHCDNCGVCLDLKLRGNHVCRADSAHDPCCICLEDAFSGCQILPCGHKIHKDCATLMIRNGMRCCPVCRQSFAHRLQRVPTPEK